nr:hypothetical protein mv_R601 [Moumouvirus Monve]
MNTNNNLRSNYTCARGKNGIGCPCLTSETHNLIINRGQVFNGQ